MRFLFLENIVIQLAEYLGVLPRGAPRGFQRGAPFGRKIGVNTPIADSNGNIKFIFYLINSLFPFFPGASPK
jgi:hypothetical protein